MPVPYAAARIDAMHVAPNGQILIGGILDYHGSTRRQGLMRLNADGTLDASLNYPYKKTFRELGLLSNGDIIALDRDSLYKISPTGIPVAKFYLGQVTTFADFCILPNDKLILVVRNQGLRRLDSNLILDPGFKNDNVFGGGMSQVIALQGNNILVAGNFNTVNGVTKNDIVRFDPDGNLDGTFSSGSGTSDTFNGLLVQADGKILFPRSFINSYNGVSLSTQRGLARLNPDGDLDTGFNPTTLFNGANNKLILQGSKILVSSTISAQSRVCRLNSDGTLDAGFNLIVETVREMALTTGNEIIASSSDPMQGMKKYTDDGVNIPAFQPNVEKIGLLNNAAFRDGFFIITGDFYRLNNINTYQIGKMDLLGTVDPNFVVTTSVNTGSSVNNLPVNIRIVSANEIFISLGRKILKLDASGLPIAGFQTPPSTLFQNGSTDPNFAGRFELLPSGEIFSAGPNGLYHLDQSGAQVPGFGFIQNINGTAYGLAIQGNKVVHGGSFTTLGGTPVNRLVRFNLDGTIDNSFNTGTGPTGTIFDLTTLPNNSLLVKHIATINGVDSNLAMHLLGEDGIVSTSFASNINTHITTPVSLTDWSLHENSILYTYITPSNIQTVGRIDMTGAALSLSLGNDIKIQDFSIESNHARVRSVGANTFLLIGELEIVSEHKATRGLLFSENFFPVITGVNSTFSTAEESPIQIQLSDISFTDADTPPGTFTLAVHAGQHYSATGNVITPETDFVGTLTVPVTVFDGLDHSVPFNLSVEVTPVNDAPVVTGTVSPLVIEEEASIVLSLNHLAVTDPDNTFPTGFSFAIQTGNHFTVNGYEIIPDTDFNGTLSVPVQVNDGSTNSPVFHLAIEVTAVNDPPVITDVISSFVAIGGLPLALTLADFTVTDPDNDFPQDFELKVQPGENYTMGVGSITPSQSFSGPMDISIKVNDGTDDSPAFVFTTNVVTDLGFMQENYQIVPNPARGMFRMRGLEGQTSIIHVLDMVGKPVANHTTLSTGSHDQEIDVTYLAVGLYLVKVEFQDGRVVMRKLVIAK